MLTDREKFDLAGGDETRLAEIKARAEKATEGPWNIYTPSDDYNEIRGLADRHVAGQCTQRVFGDVDTRENAEFIAHAREDVPWLIEQVENLTALTTTKGRGLLGQLEEANREVERLREALYGVRKVGEGQQACEDCVFCAFKDGEAKRGLGDD